MKNRILVSLASIGCIIFSCSPYRTPYKNFDVNEQIDASFLRELPAPREGSEIQIYRCNFNEVLVEDDNLIESTVRNERSGKPKVDYQIVKRYWRELLLIKYADKQHQDRNDTNYVYFTAKFKFEIDDSVNPPRARQVCLGFGPSYLGSAVDRGRNRVIQFKRSLKLNSTDDHYYLQIKSKRKSEEVSFVLPEKEITAKSMLVSKIVYLSNNKIGGQKDLVYNVDSVFQDARVLEFHLFKKF